MPDLNDEQRQVVEATSRPVLVMAPVGTGKTRVLTLRAARAVEGGVAPASILCLSFTNKAAREMQERLTAQLGKAAASITTRTFHGLCAAILRTEAETLGLDGDFLIYDEEDASELMARVTSRQGLKVDPRDATQVSFLLSGAAEKARLTAYNDSKARSSQAIFDEALKQSAVRFSNLSGKVDFPAVLRDYVHELRENHALDFADLILGVNRLWDESAPSLKAWQNRFQWIQVDEVQDTSRAEYRILRSLAAGHKQLSFFGDIDQTIYEWRGSAPSNIMTSYREEFAPLEIQLVRNYRSTKAILEVCAEVIRNCPDSVTEQIVAQQADLGDPVRMEEAATPRAEAEWIASRIHGLRKQHGLAWHDFAVLTRTNFTARDISEVFEALQLPHLKVDQQKFFQRAEIKAALAHLRLLKNTHDGNSLMRYLKTPPKGIGEATVEQLRGAPREAGLKLGDLLDPSLYLTGDPFAPLLDAYAANRIVVFDTETTGLEPSSDEIVEVAAVRCGAAGIGEKFHEFLRPSRCVGDSEAIHGWSDEYLSNHGRAPSDVLNEFRAFCGEAVLAGHNVESFDVPILESCSLRCGLPPAQPSVVFDTLDLTRRFHRLPRYRLPDLARALQLQSVPTHKAMDDVVTTVELLDRLMANLRDGAAVRRDAVKQNGSKFQSLARRIAHWRERMEVERPHELLKRILDESGLLNHYNEEDDAQKRLANLAELVRIAARNDPAHLPPREAFLQILNMASLGNDVERQADEEDRVLILTVHQAKGLEFDTVFVANATDDEFPSRRSQREGRQTEEHRLFYVALSRARKRLFISWPRVNQWNYKQLPSRFIPM